MIKIVIVSYTTIYFFHSRTHLCSECTRIALRRCETRNFPGVACSQTPLDCGPLRILDYRFSAPLLQNLLTPLHAAQSSSVCTRICCETYRHVCMLQICIHNYVTFKTNPSSPCEISRIKKLNCKSIATVCEHLN